MENEFTLSRKATVEFQKILAALVKYDERNRAAKINTAHIARKLIATGDSEQLSVRIVRTAEDQHTYDVYATLVDHTSDTTVSTHWLHEDDIAREREQYVSHHPVYEIVCLADLLTDEYAD